MSFAVETHKQGRIIDHLKTRSHHAHYQWQKLFPVSAAPTVAEFHQRCDNQGPTVTVASLSDGSVIGGYTSVSWSSNNVRLCDPDAFLFSIHPDSVYFFPATGNAQVSHNAPDGPCFGNRELFFSLAAAQAALANFALPAPSGPSAPLVNGPGVLVTPLTPTVVWTPAAGPTAIVSLEIFRLIPIVPLKSTYKTANDIQKNRLIADFGKLQRVLPRPTICLVGNSQAGKSTTINNLRSVLLKRPDLSVVAYSANGHEHATTSFKRYRIPESRHLFQGLPDYPIQLLDTIGFDNANFTDLETLIPFIAQGRVVDNWTLTNNPVDLPPAAVPGPGGNVYDHWVHLFVVVIPADVINNPAKMEQYRKLENAIRQTAPKNVPYPRYSSIVYLVTQMDDPNRNGELVDPRQMNFDCSALWTSYATILNGPNGIGNNHAFPIINSTRNGDEMSLQVQTMLLEAWRRILAAAMTNVTQWRMLDG